MKKILLLTCLIFGFFLANFHSYAEWIQIPEKHQKNIETFIKKYKNSRWVLTRSKLKLDKIEKNIQNFESENAQKLQVTIQFFLEEIHSQLARLDVRDSQELIQDIPEYTRALYLNVSAAGNSKNINQAIEIAKNWNINAVIIDLKEIDGKTSVNFHASNFSNIVPESRNLLPNIGETIKKLHENNIWVIGRIVVFKDAYLANKRPNLAIKWSTNTAKNWSDYKWNPYTDPGSKEVWKYHSELASAAYEMGFDEINFDYVRFPSDGQVSKTYYPNNQKFLNENPKWGKIMTMERFAEFITRDIKKKHPDVVLSADVFGLVTNTNLFQIGQNLESYMLYFDKVAPMVYPSHYAQGYLGYTVIDNYPYEVFKDANKNVNQKITAINTQITKAQNGSGSVLIADTFAPSRDIAKLQTIQTSVYQPWIQAFSCGWCPGATVYTSEKFNKQTRALNEDGYKWWYIWNSASRYENHWFQ